MIDVIIRARVASNLGHRMIAANEQFMRGIFKSREDALFFARRLGWSSFQVLVIEETEPQPAPAEPQDAVEPGAAPKGKRKA